MSSAQFRFRKLAEDLRLPRCAWRADGPLARGSLHRLLLFDDIGIGIDVVFIITEHPGFFVVAYDVIRKHRYLAAAAWRVDNVIGDGEAARPAAELLHYVEADFDGCAEVIRALRKI